MPIRSLERRTFLKLISASLGANFITIPGFSHMQDFRAFNSNNLYLPLKPTWVLHESGTFDIHAGNISILNCRPTIDGQSIFIKNIFLGDSPKGKRIIYEIDGGFVMLNLRTHSNMISIGAEISGMKYAPNSFCPLGEGIIEGANRFFRQGFGTGDQSGIFEIRSSIANINSEYPKETAWSYDSFLITGIIAQNGETLAMGSFEHDTFIQRSAIYNHPRRKGLTTHSTEKELIFFESGFSTENIYLKEEFIKLPDLYIYYGDQPYHTLQSLALGIADQNEARNDTNTNYYWNSFQDFRTAFSFKYLLSQMKLLDEMAGQVKVNTVHIGPGYCIPGDWLDSLDSWPKSMEDAAREIFQRRYRAGIYVAPFTAHEKSRIFRVHPNWILKNTNGVPIVMSEDNNGNLYALDANNEDVRNYIAKVFRSFRKMGFTYFELDNLEWGLRDTSEVHRSGKAKSSVQIFRSVMEIIREEVGAGSFITANKAPYSPLIGFVDAMRIDRNHVWNWDATITGHILNESYNCQYFNNIFWQNDPDVVFLRDYKNEFSHQEQVSIAIWTAFMGGAVGISDNFKMLGNNQLATWNFLEPTKRPSSAFLPFWGKNIMNKVAVRRYEKENAWAVLILNDTSETVTESYSIFELTGVEELWPFLWEPGFSIGIGRLSKINIRLNSHESKLYYLATENKNPAINMSIAGKKPDSE